MKIKQSFVACEEKHDIIVDTEEQCVILKINNRTITKDYGEMHDLAELYKDAIYGCVGNDFEDIRTQSGEPFAFLDINSLIADSVKKENNIAQSTASPLIKNSRWNNIKQQVDKLIDETTLIVRNLSFLIKNITLK
ncbi:MAG: hypothetical protein EHM45_14365 [Desulfobacteraceae bacterium]|nr:MAG: hypothetical protein EHM45_14365 [Desulfobacteraceae bacterium]